MFMTRIAKEAEPASAHDTAPLPQIWLALSAMMVAEVHDGATPEQANGLFRSLGGRLAALISIDDVRSLDGLCDQINGLWANLGLGHVAMTLDDEGVGLTHGGVPHMPPPGDDDLWSMMVGPLLEGAYDSWFRAMGSNTKLRTRLVKQNEGCIELRHAA